MSIKLVVCGAAGRMGSRIIELAKNDKGFAVVGALESAGHAKLGTGDPSISSDISLISDGDVIVEFTSPQATLEHLAVAVKARKPMVIGTTGLSDAEVKKIKEASKGIPVVFSPNMSVGINLLFKLVADAARTVPGYDVEILELHHNQKKDAPSGTAKKLFDIVAGILHRTGVYGRQGDIGARTKDEIGVMSVRAGDIVGEHTVYFAGPGERIELTHRAHSRDTLVTGALVAAKWIAGQKPGLYDMQDVLGMK